MMHLLVDGKFIALTLASTGAQGCRVDAIRVNDKLLISFSSIAKIAAVRATISKMKISSATPTRFGVKIAAAARSALMFDGSLSTESYASSSSGATVIGRNHSSNFIEFYIKDQSADKGNWFATIDGSQ